MMEDLRGSFFEATVAEEKEVVPVGLEEREVVQEKWMGKFKRADQTESSLPDIWASKEPEDGRDKAPLDDLDGTRMDRDVDGAPMDDDIDGKPMDDDVDGMPMDDIDGTTMDDDVHAPPVVGLDGAADENPQAKASEPGYAAKDTAAHSKSTAPRRRMRAEDMFADSD